MRIRTMLVSAILSSFALMAALPALHAQVGAQAPAAGPTVSSVFFPCSSVFPWL